MATGGPAKRSFLGTWRLSDEGDRISGRGWAILDDEQLRGRLFVHHGDDSGFTARRYERAAAPRHGRRRA